jgi:hypothetical protein
VKGRVSAWWTGPWWAVQAASAGEKRKEGSGPGRAQVGRWAVCVGFRPMVVKVIRV